MNPSHVKLSKFISLILRHDPQKFGVTLSAEGWLSVKALIAAAHRAHLPLDRPTLAEIVARNDKQRFRFSDDGLLIRANHGHTIPVDLALEPTPPPTKLYHGTTARFMNSILEQGLRPQKRQYVHLSVDVATAQKVGQRHGPPLILTVQAARMAESGFLFYHSASNIWLTAHVPPEYLVFDES